jgi:Na+-translocating ferredoxin:NAD+ oxidoreductase RNF subunit RnfB
MAVGKDRIRKIYELLPHINCGFCGYGNCDQFAKAVAEGSASPFGCRQNPWIGYNISEIIGVRVPAFGYQQRSYQHFIGPRLEPVPSLESLQKEVGELSKRIEGILNRIDKLGKRKSSTFSISQRTGYG